MITVQAFINIIDWRLHTMKRVILNPIKVDKVVEKVDNSVHTNNAENDDLSLQSQAELEINYDDLYDNTKDESTHEEKDNHIEKYSINTKCLISLKAARVSKEIGTPFAVAKWNRKEKRISELDNIYTLSKKIKYNEYKQGIRIGFLRSSDSFQYDHCNIHDPNQVVGVVNDIFPIRKRKGLTQRKVGYLKLNESTDTKEFYVEVTKTRNMLWLILYALIIAAIVLCLHSFISSGWSLDWDNLSFSKTAISEVDVVNELGIMHQGEVILKDGQAAIGLIGNSASGVSYKVEIYEAATNEALYESSIIAANEGLQVIEVTKPLSPGRHPCDLICEAYKDGSYLGQIQSQLVLIVEQ